MNDIECPYCDTPLDIEHDDGQGYKEDEQHQQQCDSCDKTFVFTTSVSYCYDPIKADCLNGGKHDMKPVMALPKHWPDWKRCADCGHEDRGERKFRSCKFYGGPVDQQWLTVPEHLNQYEVPLPESIRAFDIGEATEPPPPKLVYRVRYQRDLKDRSRFDVVPDPALLCAVCQHHRALHRDPNGMAEPCRRYIEADPYLATRDKVCQCKAAFEVDAAAKVTT